MLLSETTNAYGVIGSIEDNLYKYHIVILGDISPAYISALFLEKLYQAIAVDGLLGVIISGTNFMPVAYTNTLLAELLPILPLDVIRENMTIRASKELENQTPFFEGIFMDFWQNVRPITWCLMGQLRRDADVILYAVTNNLYTDSGIPLLIHRKVGKGKVFFFGFDEMWKMNYSPGPKYYRKFWERIIYDQTSPIDDGNFRLEEPDEKVDATISIEAEGCGSEMILKMVDGQSNILFNNSFSNFYGRQRISIPFTNDLDYFKIEISGISEKRDVPISTSSYVSRALLYAEDNIISVELDDIDMLPYLRSFSGKYNLIVPKVILLWDHWFILLMILMLISMAWLKNERQKRADKQNEKAF